MQHLTTKTLDGTEYELHTTIPRINECDEIHKPDKIIVPFQSFGIGTKIITDSNLKQEMMIGGEIFLLHGEATVTKVEEEDGEIIITAIEKTFNDNKKELINKILKEVDFKDGLANEFFINMLSHVFTEKQLNELLEDEDIEIVMFDGLMYLKVQDKAYRL